MVSGGKGTLVDALTEAHIRFIPLPTLKRDISLTTEIRSFFDILRILKTERPDVFHVNSSKAAGLGALAARLAGVPHIVFTAHGWPHQENRPWWQKLLIWLASYATVLLSHTVIVLSPREYRIAPAFFCRKKFRIIPIGIAPYTLRSCGDARKTLGLSDGFWFAAGTELTPNKGIDRTIAAFVPVAAEHARARLVIIGDGELRGALMEKVRDAGIEDRVVFTGFVQNARAYLSAIDCFVLASRKEGLPFVLLEAGMAHVPVIATNVGSVADVVINNETGLLIPPRAPGALADAMRTMIADATLRERTREQLHVHVVRNFSEDEMLADTLEIYNR